MMQMILLNNEESELGGMQIVIVGLKMLLLKVLI